VTDGPTRSRAAREIASAVIRLTRRASEFLDIEPPTIADLRASPTAVESLLHRLVSMIRTECSRRDSETIGGQVLVAMAVEALGLTEEWRRFRHRDIANRREELQHSLMRLRALQTEDELFDQVCEEACRASGASRALLARIDAECWIPWRRFDTAAPCTKTPAMPAAHAQPVRTLVDESAVTMSRHPMWVAGGPHPEQPGSVRNLLRGSPFAIAPIIVNGNVVGLLYATEPPTARWVPTNVAGSLHTFVVGVGHLLERAVMFTHVQAQSSYLREALSAAELVITGFDTNVDLVQLVGRQQAGPTPAGAAPWTTPSRRPDQDFTARERDVMALLARGMDNAHIAQQLTVATSTVKSHLQNMLRKAGAVNRAELIAQFYGQTHLIP
jgi:DNA-binding CsgD family transcriptional regulator